MASLGGAARWLDGTSAWPMLWPGSRTQGPPTAGEPHVVGDGGTWTDSPGGTPVAGSRTCSRRLEVSLHDTAPCHRDGARHLLVVVLDLDLLPAPVAPDHVEDQALGKPAEQGLVAVPVDRELEPV